MTGRKPPARKGETKEPARERRINDDIVVDAYDAWEQAMGWYYYLEGKLEFPFAAVCVKKRAISPLKLKEKVDVVGLPPIEVCEHELFVEVIWNDRKFSVPLDQLEYAGRDKEAREAVADWHYWVRQGYRFRLSEGHAMKRKKLKVNLAELVFAMEMGDNMERSGYLDAEIGEIIDMPDDIMRGVEEGRAESLVVDWDEELAEIAEKILGDEKSRFLLIPKRESREGYDLMADFSETVTDKSLREKLAIALDGKGAFRRFRSVLEQAGEVDRWYSFKDERLREAAVEWLLDNGIEPVQVVSGYFNDDGTEINADLVPKPGLCLTCKKDNAVGKEEVLCTLTRNDQKGGKEFECGAYEPKHSG